MNKLHTCLLLLLCYCTVGAEIRNGSITGVVRNQNGVLSDVVVTLMDGTDGTVRAGTRSDASGQYRLANLGPGTYTVVFSRLGFRSSHHSPVIVSSVAATELHVTLKTFTPPKKVEPLQQKEVTDIRSRLRQEPGELRDLDSIDRQLLHRLPERRNLWDMVELLAGVHDASVEGGVAEAGNRYTRDALDITAPFSGERAGSVPYIAAERISAQGITLSGRRALATGAEIDVVSRSADSGLTGEISTQFTRSDWMHDNTEAYAAIPAPAEMTWNNISGAFGLPLLKDRAWLFGAISVTSSETTRLLAEGVELPVRAEPEPGSVLFKADIQWDDRNRTVFSATGNENQISHRRWSGAWSVNRQTSLYSQRNRDESGLIEHTLTLTPDLLLYGRLSRFFASTDNQPVEQGASAFDLATGFFLPRTALSYNEKQEHERNTLSLSASVFEEQFLGAHATHLGFEYERAVSRRARSETDVGFYWLGEKYQRYDFGSFDAGVIMKRYAAWISENWLLTRRLSLQFALRVDRTGYTAEDPASAPAGAEEYLSFTDGSYRIGFAYDASGDGTTTIRGTVGRYYEATVTQRAEALAVLYPPQTLYYGSAVLGPFAGDQWVLWSEDPAEPLVIDAELANQYTEGISLSVDHRLNPDTTVSAGLIWKKDYNLLGVLHDSVDYRVDNITWIGREGAYRGLYYYDVLRSGSRRLTNPEFGDPGVLGDLYRRYWSLHLRFNKRFSNNWAVRASYVYSRNEGTAANDNPDIIAGQEGYDNPNYWVNRDGRLALERPHVLTLAGTIRIPLDIYVSPVLRMRSGLPYGLEARPGASPVLLEPVTGENRLEWQWLADLRLEKEFRFQNRLHVDLFLDVFNLLNDDASTALASTDVNAEGFLLPVSILEARRFYGGLRLLF